MSYSIIIPSRNVDNLRSCLAAIYRHEPGASVFVVDDGLTGHPAGHPAGPDYLPGVKPFVFARNVNIGICEALRGCVIDVTMWGDSERRFLNLTRTGVILLNDDGLLETPGGFTALAQQAAEHPEYGIISAACNNVGNVNQHPRGHGLRDEARMVCFVCAYIPRATIERVGLLDERFVGYGMDDDDYCLRVRQAGLKIGIFDGCFVEHGRLHSTFRGGPRSSGDYRPNLKRFIDKWGVDNFGRPA